MNKGPLNNRHYLKKKLYPALINSRRNNGLFLPSMQTCVYYTRGNAIYTLLDGLYVRLAVSRNITTNLSDRKGIDI